MDTQVDEPDPDDLRALPDWYDCSSTGTLVNGVHWNDFAAAFGWGDVQLHVPGHSTSLNVEDTGPAAIETYGTERVDWDKFRVELECSFSASSEPWDDSGNEPARGHFKWVEGSVEGCPDLIQDYIDFGQPGIAIESATGAPAAFRQEANTWSIRGCLDDGSRFQLHLEDNDESPLYVSPDDAAAAAAAMAPLLDAFLQAVS